MQRRLLLVDCPDQPGLIAKITNFLYQKGCNITSNQEFVDEQTSRFFMRTEFTLDSDPDGMLLSLKGLLPEMAWVRLAPTGPRRIVVLVTREPHCLGELLLRHAYGELGAEILAVIGNHATLASLVERFGLPFHHIDQKDLSRAEHEEKLDQAIASYDPEYIVLAKYMRILSPEFVAHYPNRIINIHHSFLPAFIGAKPYQQAYERGVKIIGATAHFVTADLDQGPIIAQSVIPIDHSHSSGAMAQAGRDVEKIVLARALKFVFEERVFLSENRTIVFE